MRIPSHVLLDSSWQSLANCIGEDPSLFFPEKFKGATKQAKAICAECVVRSECLEYALKAHETEGFWGGLNTTERRDLARRRRRAARRAA